MRSMKTTSSKPPAKPTNASPQNPPPLSGIFKPKQTTESQDPPSEKRVRKK